MGHMLRTFVAPAEGLLLVEVSAAALLSILVPGKNIPTVRWLNNSFTIKLSIKDHLDNSAFSSDAVIIYDHVSFFTPSL